MRGIQQSILEGQFPDFIQDFFKEMFPDKAYPHWAVEALRKVNVDLCPDGGDKYRSDDTQNEAGETEDKMDTEKVKNNLDCENVNSGVKYEHQGSGDNTESLNAQPGIAKNVKFETESSTETTNCVRSENVIK